MNTVDMDPVAAHNMEAAMRNVRGVNILVRRSDPNALLPTRATEGAAGYDIYSLHSGTIAPGAWALVQTGIQVAIPEGCVGLVWPRSGLAVRNGIDTGAGVIDSDYRGPLGILLFNHSEHVFSFAKGDRIAQLVVQKVETLPLEEVSALPASVRGNRGFGSTGL